jgi:cytochrome b6-f complex iron-sulfur subunit
MERRTFIRTMEGLLGAALCGVPALSGCTSFRYVSYTLDGNRLVVRCADFGEGSYALIDNPQVPRAIYLHRLSADEFVAVLTRCMHRGCQVEPAGDRLACPCHGSEYAFTGEVLHGPAEHPLFRYEVVTDGENIYIHLPAPGTL